jgi:diguanylate cyclase (GGDEF)-like protein
MALLSTRLPTVQARISALVVACVLPAALAASWLIYHDYRMQRASLESGTIETARALSQAVDRELIGAEATLRVLATSPLLKNGDLQNFYRQTQDVLSGSTDISVVLSDMDGNVLFNTTKPFGESLAPQGDAGHFKQLSNLSQPVISALFAAEGASQIVAVELTVRKDGKPHYVLSMQFLPERFGSILERQYKSLDEVISLLDSNQAVIAISQHTRRLEDIHLDNDALSQIKNQGDGTVKINHPDHTPVIFAFHRSLLSNWTLVIGIETVSLLGTLWEELALIVIGTLVLLTLGLASARVIGDRISRSIKGLVAPALALGHGNAVIVPALHLREADEVGKALVKAAQLIQVRTVERDMAKQQAQHIHEIKQQFEYQAYHDPLTGLANRMLFNEIIKNGISACGTESLIVLYIDIDNFKQINDTHGHAIGDELLRLFAARLKAGLRESDVTARLGGDEFAAILMRTNLNHAKTTADALVESLSRPYVTNNLTLHASASIGVAGYPDSASSIEVLLRQADTAMYAAKARGKRRCAVYEASMESERNLPTRE